MNPNSPDNNDVPKAGGEPHPDGLSLEALFTAIEAGKLEPFCRGEITPLGRLYFGDRCERPVEEW
ncbi:MAG: hypothetical protein M0C28_06215 [Candidatus Moduliflexus flocculans]|nr:hypothetical protein [Candidatus Moduliflexus flocculans]